MLQQLHQIQNSYVPKLTWSYTTDNKNNAYNTKSGANASNITITRASGESTQPFSPSGSGGTWYLGGSSNHYADITDSTATKAWEFGTGDFTIEYYIFHTTTLGTNTYNPHIAGLSTNMIYIARNSGNFIVRRAIQTIFLCLIMIVYSQ